MNSLIQSLHEGIKKQLHPKNYELLEMIQLPPTGDNQVRIQTLQELLNEFDTSKAPEAIAFLIQIRPKNSLSPSMKTEKSEIQASQEAIYLSNGKLNVPYLFKNAEILFNAGDYPLARNILKSILASGTHTGPALYHMGKCFEAEGKLEEARANYEQAITYHPTIETYRNLAQLLIKQKKDQNAAEILKRSLHVKNLTPSIRFELHKTIADCWSRAQKQDEAEQHYLKALEIDPSADDIRTKLGNDYLQNNRIGEAKRYFKEALSSQPKNHLALAGLGSCYFTEGDKKSAHEYFVKSLEIEINSPSTLFFLVKCAYETKTYSTATTLLSKYIELAPQNTNLLFSLAGLQFHLGRMQDAKNTTLKILQIQPQHGEAKNLINMIDRYLVPSNQ
jgi:tetratricopeptide (TPR) repeat protein